MINRIKDFYEKQSTIINIVSIALGVIGTIFGIYIAFNPIDFGSKLNVVVDTNANYLVKGGSEIKDLKIAYKDRDIKKDTLNLEVYKIRIVNRGKSPVRLIDYAENDFTIKIFNGKTIALEPVTDNNKFLAHSLNAKVVDSVTIKLNKIVFNPQDEVVLNAYILHNPKGKPLDFYSLGRLAGQPNGDITLFFESELEPTFWSGDDWWIVGILVIFFSAVFFLGLGIAFIAGKMREKYREIRISKKFDFKFKKLNTSQIFFIKVYKNFGKKRFFNLLKELQQGDDFIKKEEETLRAYNIVNSNRKKEVVHTSEYYFVEDKLKENNLIIKTGDKDFVISEELKEEVEKTLKLFSNEL
ncbi:MAG: hypothetical protein Q8M29_04870 [Bacteroidota bacterium]|nr:hypothetical protein [Bacteroidota bacterium]